jgi:hypothetical protein
VRQAGSVDALVAALREGRVFARHGGLYCNGSPWRSADLIPCTWWVASVARDIRPEAGQAVFVMDLIGVSIPVTAIAIEVEPAGLFAAFRTHLRLGEDGVWRDAGRDAAVTETAEREAVPETPSPETLPEAAVPEALPEVAPAKAGHRKGGEVDWKSLRWFPHANELALAIVAENAALSHGGVALEIIVRWKLELKHPDPRRLETFVADRRRAAELSPCKRKQPSR